jgi:hypothetical protein
LSQASRTARSLGARFERRSSGRIFIFDSLVDCCGVGWLFRGADSSRNGWLETSIFMIDNRIGGERRKRVPRGRGDGPLERVWLVEVEPRLGIDFRQLLLRYPQILLALRTRGGRGPLACLGALIALFMLHARTLSRFGGGRRGVFNHRGSPSRTWQAEGTERTGKRQGGV